MISGSPWPIFTKFSPYRRYLIVDYRYDFLFPRTEGALPWQPICVTVPNVVQIDQAVAQIWPFFNFQDGGYPSYRIVGIFNCWYDLEGQCSSTCQILQPSAKLLQTYGRLQIFQDGGSPPPWISKSWKLLTARNLRRANMCHHAKFCADRSRRCGDMAFFEMAAVRHLGFLKVANVNCLYHSEGQYASLCQNFCRSASVTRLSKHSNTV